MPAAMPARRAMGMLLMIHSRILKSDKAKKITPERNTAPSATCQVWPMVRTTV
ncbi:hypothetical protein D9M68_776480 [compost metagenome]